MLKQHLRPPHAWAYDGDKMLFTLQSFDGEMLELVLNQSTPGELRVRIRQTTKLDLGSISSAISSSARVGDSRPLLHVLDIVLKHHNGMMYRTVGQVYLWLSFQCTDIHCEQV